MSCRLDALATICALGAGGWRVWSAEQRAPLTTIA
jgi:hypothetical protein